MKVVTAAIIQGQGRFFVARRGSGEKLARLWEFPGGKVEPGETLQESLTREIKEELGIESLKIVCKGDKLVSYLFPKGVDWPIVRKYSGQQQRWFLLALESQQGPKLEEADGEFRSIAWMPMRLIIDGIVEWKKEAYLEGFQSLGL
jgi:mutator protein MutT